MPIPHHRCPAGVISYRNLSQFGNVTLYERRDDVGGVWYLDDPPLDLSHQSQVEQRRTGGPKDTAVKGSTGNENVLSINAQPRWPSPSYPGLIGNVLPEFLSFSYFPFPARLDPNQPFPTLQETHEFLRNFAQPYIREGKMKLNMEVVRVEELPDDRGWKVQTRDWNKGGGMAEEVWDAVVLAVGWSDHPVWPKTPGLDILRQRGFAQHAKCYRGPQGNEDKCALIIGNANSGNDIAAHLAPIAKYPVYQSIRRPAFPGFPRLPDDRIQMVAPVERYDIILDKITAHLQDGTILMDIDIVHIATGYKPYPDFVHVLDPTVSKPTKLVNQNPHPSAGTRIPSLHRHIIYAYNPSLAFIGSPMSFTPFIINDVSSLWLTYIWNLSIPLLFSPPSSLLEFEHGQLEAIDEWRKDVDNPSALYSYSVLGASEEEYAEGLRKEVVNANSELDEYLPKWTPRDERRMWRERMYPIKFEALKYSKEHSVPIITNTKVVDEQHA